MEKAQQAFTVVVDSQFRQLQVLIRLSIATQASGTRLKKYTYIFCDCGCLGTIHLGKSPKHDVELHLATSGLLQHPLSIAR